MSRVVLSFELSSLNVSGGLGGVGGWLGGYREARRWTQNEDWW